jgi:DNA repair protein RadC
MNVKLSKEQKIKVTNPNDIFLIMQQILMRENKIGRDQEHFWIVGLSVKNIKSSRCFWLLKNWR